MTELTLNYDTKRLRFFRFLYLLQIIGFIAFMYWSITDSKFEWSSAWIEMTFVIGVFVILFIGSIAYFEFFRIDKLNISKSGLITLISKNSKTKVFQVDEDTQYKFDDSGTNVILQNSDRKLTIPFVFEDNDILSRVFKTES